MTASITLRFEAVKCLNFRVIALFHAASSDLMKFRLSAPDRIFEVNNPIKMTAIITLMGANDDLEALLGRLLFKLRKYFI